MSHLLQLSCHAMALPPDIADIKFKKFCPNTVNLLNNLANWIQVLIQIMMRKFAYIAGYLNLNRGNVVIMLKFISIFCDLMLVKAGKVLPI